MGLGRTFDGALAGKRRVSAKILSSGVMITRSGHFKRVDGPHKNFFRSPMRRNFHKETATLIVSQQTR